MINGIFLLLGGNIGDPHNTFIEVHKQLKEKKIISLTTSSVYETSAWGKEDQPDFLNQVIKISTTCSPEDLLKEVLSIERAIGRERNEKWGPRVIDIDLLYYHQEIFKTNKLTIPHPQIQNRRFTLAPMAEIAPAFIHPILKKSQQQLLALCNDPLPVKVLS